MNYETEWSIKSGKAIIIGNKVYMRCEDCGKLICTNKTFFGSLHVCAK
jgi:hypothetical protein